VAILRKLDRPHARPRGTGHRDRVGRHLRRALEIHLAVDESHFYTTVAVERVAVEDRQVRVPTYFDGTDPLLQAELLGGIERHGLERVGLAHAAVFDAFRGLLV